jgi:Rrf2 family protein
MLSNTSRYAIRALIYLAIHADKKKKIGIKKIAKDLEIPSPFLGKILQSLSKQKIVSSTKGPNGGFQATEATMNVNLMTIIRIIDGDDLFDRCLITNKLCSELDVSHCAIHNHYESVRKSMKEMFTEHTIGKLAHEFIAYGNMLEL